MEVLEKNLCNAEMGVGWHMRSCAKTNRFINP